MSNTKVAADILGEFLEVAFHAILYMREIYPINVFEQRRKYDVPVQICLHSDVRGYISDLLRSVEILLVNRKIESIVLVILDSSGLPVERFVFQIVTLENDSEKDASYIQRLEHSLRAFLLKLYTCDAELQPHPPDCTWTVQIHTTESAMLDLQRNERISDFHWIEAEKKETELPNARLIPLKAMDSSLIKMQLYAEELSKKQ